MLSDIRPATVHTCKACGSKGYARQRIQIEGSRIRVLPDTAAEGEWTCPACYVQLKETVYGSRRRA